jgi:hypothetical protein
MSRPRYYLISPACRPAAGVNNRLTLYHTRGRMRVFCGGCSRAVVPERGTLSAAGVLLRASRR